MTVRNPGTGLPTAAGRPSVVVVGAGVAGLACARHLVTLARERDNPLDLLVLDASPRAGGVITTVRRDGFLVEGGPDCFISEKPWALDLCRRLGLGEEIIGTNPECRRSFVLRGTRTMPIPEGYQLMAPGRLLPFASTPILSPAGKLRAALDLLLPRGPERGDESLASFVRRRFGREVLERLAQPLLAGIYNADPEDLSLRATMPRFLEMERRHRSIILALLRSRRRTAAARDASTGMNGGVSGARYSLFVTLRDGLQTLIDRLQKDLPPGSLRLRARATGLAAFSPGTGEAAPKRYVITLESGERIFADAMVLAMPANASAPLLRRLDPALSDRLAGINYGTSVTVSLAYRAPDVSRPLKGFGFVVPRSEGRRLIACSVSSVKFAGRAPAQTVLLRCFLGGPWAEEREPDDLERTVRGELREVLGITAPPLLARTFVWPRAMAQYRVGHLDTVEAIEQRLAGHPGLALAGNGLRGVGIPDCVHSGELAAERILTGSVHTASTARQGNGRVTMPSSQGDAQS